MKKNKTESFRVLAVDDEESILTLYKDVLLKKTDSGERSEMSNLEAQLFGNIQAMPNTGYTFDLKTCHQGDEAVDQVKQSIEKNKPFALVLLDIKMPPGPDGVQTAAMIRALDPMIEILMVTGYSDVTPMEIASRVSPPHKLLYIQKPFHPHEIYQFVCTLCSKWKNEAFVRNYNEKLLSHIKEQTDELTKANKELWKEIEIREESETALRESEKKFRDLFERSSDYLYLHDLEGNLINSNLAFKTECGYDEEYLHFRNIRDLTPTRYRDKFDEYLKRIVEKGHDEDIMILLAKDGRELVVEYNNSLMLDSNGKPLAVRGAGRDVTERLKVEEQQHNLEVQLMRMQRMEAIGTLAGGIAHNFNNLLMGILGNASLAALEIDSNSLVHHNLKNIKTLVESGSRLTKQLLEYSKGGTYQVEPLSLSLLVKKTSDTLGETRKDIHIHYDLDDLCAIDADRGQVEQVLLNLFVNAADAMPAGGDLFLSTKMTSHLDLANKPFTVKPGDYVQFIVRDTGIGMDQETIEHIFDPFFTTKGPDRGTGLGLASTYGIIKMHRGYIEVDSKKGVGTSFIIYLPASEKMATQETAQKNDIVYGNETILLIDDEEIVLEASERLLCYLGYSVIKAKGGKDAINIFSVNSAHIDLVILDLVMPEFGGSIVFDALLKIKKDVKVILASGYNIDGQAQEVIDRGCKGFLHKPFDIKDLSSKIRDVLK